MTLLFLILSLPVYAVGLLVFWHVARQQHSPADASNRINKLRLVWFALTREELFVNAMPWLRRDELDNVEEDKNHSLF